MVRVPPVVREGFSGRTRAAFLPYSKSFINSFLCYNSFVCYGNVANSFICYINLKFIWANYVLLKPGVYTPTLKKHQVVRYLKKFENHCDRGITRKYRNPEARWTRRKVFVATQKQYWWDGCTRPTHHQLLQLLTVIQKSYIIAEKWRSVKTIRHLKRSDKKVGWRYATFWNRYRLFLDKAWKVSKQWLTWWGRTLYISEYVMHNSVGVVKRSRDLLQHPRL